MTHKDTYVTYEKPTNQRGRDSRPLLIFYEGVGANMSDVVIVALITGGQPFYYVLRGVVF